MADLTLPAGNYTLYVEGTVSFRNRSSSEIVSGSAPEPFTENDWSIELAEGNTSRIKITSLPENNGQTIGYTEYRVNNGNWTSLNAPRGSFVVPLANVFSNQFELRAVNFSGASDTSDVKTVGVGSSFFITTSNIEISTEIAAPTLTANYPISTSDIVLTTEITAPTVSAVAPVPATLVITDASYSDGDLGSGPSLAISGLALTGSVGPYTVFGATHANGTTVSKDDIENGTGDAEDIFDFSDADGVVSNQLESLSTSLTDGHMTLFVRDSNNVESGTYKIDGVNVDATALTVSSSVPADGATSVATNSTIAITFSEDAFGVVGKDFYLYDDIDTTPVLVETFTFDDDDSATGDNGGTASIVDDVLTLTPGAMAGSTQHSVRWEAGAVTDPWGNDIAANTGDTALNFTTAAAPTVTMPPLTSFTDLVASEASNVYTGATTGLGAGDFIVGVGYQTTGSAQTITNMVIDGQTVTPEVASNYLNVAGVALYKVTTTNTDWNIVLTMSSALNQGAGFVVWGPGTAFSVIDTASASGANITSSGDLSLNTETDGKIIGMATAAGTNTPIDTLTGISLTTDSPFDVDNNDSVAGLEASVTTGEAPRTVTIDSSSGGLYAACVISLGAA
jgi:hypothetical protein